MSNTTNKSVIPNSQDQGSFRMPNSYSPSVPMSVYRELASELQAAQNMLSSLNNQNQQLVVQNQLLRQELMTFIQLGKRSQQIVDQSDPLIIERSSRSDSKVVEFNPNHPQVQRVPTSEIPKGRKVRKVKTSVNPPVEFFPIREANHQSTILQEEENGRGRTYNSTESLSTWSLAGILLLIVLTAFGAGYLVVGPLLKK